jgi:LmbE family N-acetylglucosaminyl deacetylase
MPYFRPTLRLAVASFLFAAASLRAQQVADPANLTGEHVSPPALADTLPINSGAAGLQQLLVKLRTRASMMLVVAHPDDEDGGFLTYESRGQGARVAMLTLTRGEGGQNLMSADFDDALGLLRTQELLAADRYMGVDQFFGTEVDFGFSKTKEETLAKWTHERVLYDAVRCVRLYRPLVIAAVFVGGVTDGHGQHQVSGEIAQEVFLAAADPKVFPEMGLPPWAPLKVYSRSPFARIDGQGMFDYATGKYSPVLFHNYVTGADITHAPVPTVMIHEGEASTLLGMNGDTYIQFARKGLALQKSQNGGQSRGPGSGAFDAGYTLMAARTCASTSCPTLAKQGWTAGSELPEHEQTIFDSVDTTLPSIATLAPDAPVALHQSLVESLTEVDRLIGSAAGLFKPENLQPTVAPLSAALVRTDSLIAAVDSANFDATQKYNVLHELRIKHVQLNRALTFALGITVDPVVPSTSPQNLVPGHAVTVRASLATTSATPLEVISAAVKVAGHEHPMVIPAQPVATPTLLSASAPLTLAFEDRLPADTPLTRPAFSHANIDQPFYTVDVPALRNAPAAPAPLIAEIKVRGEGGLMLDVPAYVRVSSEAPAVPQAAVVVPALSVSVAPSAGIIALKSGSFQLNVSTRSELPSSTAVLKMMTPPGWKSEAAHSSVTLERVGQSSTVPFNIVPARLERNTRYTVSATAESGGHLFSESYRAVGYPGITYTNLYMPATYRAASVDLTTAPGLKVAYLPGTGDSVAELLAHLGVTPTILKIADLTAANLAQYDEVILGVRAYSAHPQLAGAGSKPLLDYAANGGVVVVQYNNGRYSEAEAPYPITTPMSSGDHAHDVVEEAQPVEVLVPNAPLLSWPNKITAADFNDWVSERGHAFAGTWGPQFTALLETHDAGQEPQKGGLIVAPVGKGAYIYCGLALYRQLPEGVPGAYRLFANLLSYPKNPSR